MTTYIRAPRYGEVWARETGHVYHKNQDTHSTRDALLSTLPEKRTFKAVAPKFDRVAFASRKNAGYSYDEQRPREHRREHRNFSSMHEDAHCSERGGDYMRLPALNKLMSEQYFIDIDNEVVRARDKAYSERAEARIHDRQSSLQFLSYT